METIPLARPNKGREQMKKERNICCIALKRVCIHDDADWHPCEVWKQCCLETRNRPEIVEHSSSSSCNTLASSSRLDTDFRPRHRMHALWNVFDKRRNCRAIPTASVSSKYRNNLIILWNPSCKVWPRRNFEARYTKLWHCTSPWISDLYYDECCCQMPGIDPVWSDECCYILPDWPFRKFGASKFVVQRYGTT